MGQFQIVLKKTGLFEEGCHSRFKWTINWKGGN